MNNVVDLDKFRQTKGDGPAKFPNQIAIMHDRCAYVLRGTDGMMETIEGVQAQEGMPTHAERQMIVQIQYLERLVRQLVHKHEPHRLLDDYLTYSYTDWEVLAQTSGPEAMAWHRAFQDPPQVLIQRAIWPIITSVRTHIEVINSPAKLSSVMQEADDTFKLLTSDISPFVFRFDSPSDVEGLNFKVRFTRKPNRGDKVDPVGGGELHIPKFWSSSERIVFMTAIFTARSSRSIIDMANHYIKIAEGGHITTK